MLGAFALLLVCQLTGELLSRTLGLPVPGPVSGLVILAIALPVWQARHPHLHAARPLFDLTDTLLGTLGLLFVPAGVGVIGQLSLLGENALALVGVLALSTIITMLATVSTFLAVKKYLVRA